MTRPVRHTIREMENAARLAEKYGLSVRLEPDGAITFSPSNDEPETQERERPMSLEWWRSRKRND